MKKGHLRELLCHVATLAYSECSLAHKGCRPIDCINCRVTGYAYLATEDGWEREWRLPDGLADWAEAVMAGVGWAKCGGCGIVVALPEHVGDDWICPECEKCRHKEGG
jgi:hypothetical protein